jgi:hypothetical protein
VTAVDAPPGLPFGGQPSGEFVARPGSRKLAGWVLGVVAAMAVATLWAARRRLVRHPETMSRQQRRFAGHWAYSLGAGTITVATVPVTALAIAGVGYAIRRARLRIDRDGVRWGWAALGFRMPRGRLERALAYRDAVAFRPRRGSPWYLARRDWDRFDRVPTALGKAGIPFEVHDRRAPFRSRLQSYGLVLDLLLVADAISAVLAFLLAIS